MVLAELCDMGGNYIGQIEMGRRIPSFEKIEKIAAALDIESHELFVWEKEEKQREQKPNTKDYLKKMPANVKKEIISRMAVITKKNIYASLDPQEY